MDPDLFITIAFGSFVFVAGMVGFISMRVMLVRTHRRGEDTYELEEPSAAAARAPRGSPKPTPGRSRASRGPDRPRRSGVRT